MERYRSQDNAVQYTRPSSAPERELVEPTRESRLHIAVLAPPWIPVPPPGYGGIEFVVALLCDALVEHDHDVELFCAPGSQLARQGPPAARRGAPREHRTLALRGRPRGPGVPCHRRGRGGRRAVRRRARPLRLHAAGDGRPARHAAGAHGARTVRPRHQALLRVPRPQAARRLHQPRPGGHGTRPRDRRRRRLQPDRHRRLAVSAEKQDYLLWVGRFVAEKGPQRAIRVAKAVGRRSSSPGSCSRDRSASSPRDPAAPRRRADPYVGEVGGAASSACSPTRTRS